MFGRFFLWIEEGVYRAVTRGFGRAIGELSSGEAGGRDAIDVLPHEEQDVIEDASPKPVKKKAARRK